MRGPSARLGSTPLIYAVEGGSAEIVRMLVSAGAEIRVHGPESLLSYTLHDPEITCALLGGGADPNALAVVGQMPILAYAMELRHCNTAMVLIEHGADVNASCTRNRTMMNHAVNSCFSFLPQLVPSMLQQGWDPDVRLRDWNDASLLMVLARDGDVQLVRTLLEAGADSCLTDSRGRTALEWAHERDDEHREEIIRLLLEYAGNR
jgi:ankyrin repeat protein